MKRTIHTVLKRTLVFAALVATSIGAWADNVAKIGETEYATLQAAVSAANVATEASTIQLLADINAGTETYTISNSKIITLDMNGKTITAHHTSEADNVDASRLFNIASTGNLKVTGNGAINEYQVRGIFYNQGTLAIENGTFTTTYEGYGVIYNTGSQATCTVNDGTFTGAYAAVYNVNAATMTINDGAFNGASSGIVNRDASTKLTVNGGSFTGKTGIDVTKGATLSFVNGTINCTNENDWAIVAKNTGTNVTISGGSVNAYYGVAVEDGANLSITGGNLTATKHGVQVKDNGSTVLITGGSVSGKDGVYVVENASLTVDGGTITGTNTAISGNGSEGSGNTTIIINGGTIKNENEVAIYHPQIDGSLKITGGTIIGTTAVEVRAGSVEISGGSLTATASVYSCTPNGNGSTTKGAAIAIAQHTTKDDITATITGGTFTGVKAISEANPQENNPAPQVTMSVTNGTYNGGVTVTDVQNFISGGTFSEQPDLDYCASGFLPKDNGDGTYGVTNELVMDDAMEISNIPTKLNGETVSTATYTRNTGMVGAGSTTGTKYGTICLPFSITAKPANMKLYKATNIVNSTLTITEVEASSYPLVAGTPLIFELTNAATTMSITSSNATVNTTAPATSPVTGNILVGTYAAKNISSDLEKIYYLNGDKFHQAKVSLTVPAYRAYLVNENANEVKAEWLNISTGDDDETAISSMEMNQNAVVGVYDLNGRKQNNLQRGVNIIRHADGSTIKVIVK